MLERDGALGPAFDERGIARRGSVTRTVTDDIVTNIARRIYS